VVVVVLLLLLLLLLVALVVVVGGVAMAAGSFFSSVCSSTCCRSRCVCAGGEGLGDGGKQGGREREIGMCVSNLCLLEGIVT